MQLPGLMHRRDLLQQLERYLSRWAAEAGTVRRFVDFVASHEDCFERSLKAGHVTGSAWLVNAAGTHVLLTHHRKLDRWLQLGGHADGDPDVRRVALREAVEESGLEAVEPVSDDVFDIDIHEIPERGNEPVHFHYDVRYAMQVVGDMDFVVSDESHDLSWVEISTMADYSTEESMLRMARKWLSFHGTAGSE